MPDLPDASSSSEHRPIATAVAPPPPVAGNGRAPTAPAAAGRQEEEDRPLLPGDAQTALERILSSEVDTVEEDTLELPRLQQKYGKEFVLVIRVRDMDAKERGNAPGGLDEDRIEEIEQIAQRPTTDQEQQAMAMPTRMTRDFQKYNAIIAAEAVVEPSFADPAFIQKWGQPPRGAKEPASAYWVARHFLMPGERQVIAQIVLEMLGYRPGAVTRLSKKS